MNRQSAPQAFTDEWKRQDRRYHEQRRVAETYDRRVARFYRLDHKRYTLEPWKKRMRSDGARRVLDFGCGTGEATLSMATDGFDVVSADASLAMLSLVREKAEARGLGVLCVLADGERLPFRDGAFDAVVCTGVLHHMPDPGSGAASQARVISPGGRLFLSEPYGETSRLSRPRHWLFGLARSLRDRLRGQDPEEGAQERPLRRHHVEAITETLEGRGFAYNISRFTYWPYLCGFLPEALAWPLMRALDILKSAERGDAVKIEAQKAQADPKAENG